MEKRRNCSLGAISPLFHNIFYLLLDFHVQAGNRFSLRDKGLFEISEVEIARVNCTRFSCAQTFINNETNDRVTSYYYVFNPYPAEHDNPYLRKPCRSKSGGFCSEEAI